MPCSKLIATSAFIPTAGVIFVKMSRKQTTPLRVNNTNTSKVHPPAHVSFALMFKIPAHSPNPNPSSPSSHLLSNSLNVNCVKCWDFFGRNSDIQWSHFRLHRSLTSGGTRPVYLPSPEFPSKLLWPVSTNPNNSSTFFFVGLFKDARFHSWYEMCCQAGWIVLTGLS